MTPLVLPLLCSSALLLIRSFTCDGVGVGRRGNASMRVTSFVQMAVFAFTASTSKIFTIDFMTTFCSLVRADSWLPTVHSLPASFFVLVCFCLFVCFLVVPAQYQSKIWWNVYCVRKVAEKEDDEDCNNNGCW